MRGVEQRLKELGLELPEPMRPPPGVSFRFELVRLHGGLAYVSGHGPVEGERTLARGRVGDDIALADAG